MKTDVSLEKLMEVGAHFGHQARRWDPKMKPYIYEEQKGIHVFDLIKTKEALDEALDLLYESAKKGKSIVLLGTKKQAKKKIEEVAEAAGVYFVNERWLGGTITNFDQIKKSLKKLTDMKKKSEEGEYKERTKKEQLLIEREIARLQRFFGGLEGLEGLPDVLFVVDTKRESTAVNEANMKDVTTIGIVDTNADPTVIDYPIPMNDDATKAIEYVLSLVADALIKGKRAKKKKTAETKKKEAKTKKSTKTEKKGSEKK
jgi:small subunit ribosomal protein S2